MIYTCNNLSFQNGDKIEPCGRTWNSTEWNKDIDTEYTRNEKCSKCGDKDITSSDN